MGGGGGMGMGAFGGGNFNNPAAAAAFLSGGFNPAAFGGFNPAAMGMGPGFGFNGMVLEVSQAFLVGWVGLVKVGLVKVEGEVEEEVQQG